MAPQVTPSRSANACEQCRRRKVKCSGEHPCRTCSRQKIQCSFPLSGRGRFSDAYVEGLLATIKAQEEQIKAVEGARTRGPAAQDETSPAGPINTPSTVAGLHGDGISPASSAPTERASGPAFELRVRSLLQQRQVDSIPGPTPRNIRGPSQSGVQNTSMVSAAGSLTEMLDRVPRAEPPSETESHHLLALFLTWLGVNQHFFDSRLFVDTMTLLFQTEVSRRKTMESVWFVEYLLVMAMGKLMDFDTDVNTPHGLDYFAQAMQIMPPMHRINDCGIIGVEILSLVALNLQWRERKYEAYFYIGIAVRLAVTLGCALPHDEQVLCLPSERAHRIRVWWTVFMLDRRLSADLGLPVAADDRQLSTELPQDAPGFPSPQAIITNVKIARATGTIMTSLYGTNSFSQLDLVQNVQTILSSLYETGHSIPLEYTIDLGQPFPTVTRTGGSLYLMLFQAIILCTRPILLQRVKEKVMASLAQDMLDSTTPAIRRMSSTCKESAIKSIRILYGLRKKRQVARFGFFDLDATFSAALTLVMVGFVDGVEDISGMPPELEQAVDVLLHLSVAGNRAAEQRLRDIRQFCSFVWPTGTPVGPHSAGTTKEVNNRAEPPSLAENSSHQDEDWADTIVVQDMNVSPAPLEEQESGQSAGEQRSSGIHPAEGQVPTQYLVDFERGYDFMDLNMAADGIYSSFNDPNLPLTGVDLLDWAEMEKVFAGRSG